MFPNFSDAVLAIVLFASAVCSTTAYARPSATIDAGVIVGTATSVPSSTNTVNKFLGIPFAAPPIRFAPPVSPKPWTKPFQANKNAPSCIQQFPNELIESLVNNPPPEAGESEDCLYINVYAPAAPAPKEGRTVMFWLYGGDLLCGHNSWPYYDGSSFATHQDVIIVAPNYRTNAFGFPMSPQLPLTDRNLGFLDQRLALEWTRQNIRAFGGDPEKITIFGQSAGSASVDELVTTTPRNPPFRAAIMQSGQTSLYINHNNSDTPQWDSLIEALNCTSAKDVLECARSANASAIKTTEQNDYLFFTPISDNKTQLEFPEAARVAKNVAQVPILTGTVANEGRVFAMGQSNTTEYLDQIFPGQPNLWSAIESAYPLGSSPNLANSYYVDSAIFTDYQFQCPSAIAANDSYATGIPTWRYLYNATFPNLEFNLDGGKLDLGVFHGSEIALVFGTFPRDGATKEQMELSRNMQKAWADFAKNPTKGPGWKGYPSVNVFGPGAKEHVVDASALDTHCGLYREVYEATGVIG